MSISQRIHKHHGMSTEMDSYSEMQRDELLIHSTLWMNLEINTASGRRQVQKSKLVW